MNIKSDGLLRNMSWMGASELMSRISRLVAAVVLARQLGVQEYGVVAIAMTTAELVNVLTRNGIGARIIQASDEELEGVCQSAYRYNWNLCICLCFIQCALALPVASFYQSDVLAGLIAALALSYLIYPLSMVQVYRCQRANRMRLVGLTTGVQISLDNLLSACLAALGFGLWSVILPKLGVAPLWVMVFRRFEAWRPNRFKPPASPMLGFSAQVLLTEIIKTLRGNLDKLLIGRLLGLEALGLYHFALNAGIGLSLSLITAFNTAIYPHLCGQRDSLAKFKRAYRRCLRMVFGVSLIVLGAQCIGAQWYVPWVFGSQWQSAIPLVMILILSAIPRPMAETAGLMLRAIDKPWIDLIWNLLFTCCYVLLLLWIWPFGLLGIALATLSLHLLLIPVYLIWLRLHLFSGRTRLIFQGAYS